MNTPLLAPSLPPLVVPGPEDVHVAAGILGTTLIKVYAPGTAVPLIVVEVDPRIMSEELVGRVWRYVSEHCPKVQPDAPPALTLLP